MASMSVSLSVLAILSKLTNIETSMNVSSSVIIMNM